MKPGKADIENHILKQVGGPQSNEFVSVNEKVTS